MARKRTLITLPLRSITDQSLTLRDIKILGALEYFCDRATGISSPERHELSTLTGIRQEHVSKITTNLERAGWIEKTGRGCRSNPTIYRLLWIVKEGENEPVKGAADGTQSDSERVPLVAPNRPAKGAAGGTQSPAKGATDGTQSGLKGATDCTQSGLKGAVSGTQSRYQRVGAHAYKYLYIYKYITNRSDRSDSTRVGESEHSKFGLTDAINTLVSFGTPHHFFRKPEDRQIIASWIQAGVDRTWLVHVCETAMERKKDGKPIGPKYIDRVMQSMAEESKSAVGQEFSKTDYRQTW